MVDSCSCMMLVEVIVTFKGSRGEHKGHLCACVDYLCHCEMHGW